MQIERNFAAFILTHGRSDNVYTYQTLRRYGYSGQIFLIVDDEDKHLADYQRKFPGEVVVFSKNKAALLFDEGDNFKDKRAVVYARNALWQIAEQLGVTHFIELDDDYTGFYYRIDENGFYGNWRLDCDWLFSAICDYIDKTPFVTVALSQGGDHIGGGGGVKSNCALRKAMNAFVCRTDRPFKFLGRINEDTTAYTFLQRQGVPFLTLIAAQLIQKTTQANEGGLTDIYKSMGTYVKSFYSVLFTPSAVSVSTLKSSTTRNGKKTEGYARLHHKVDWKAIAPQIIREKHRKPRESK